MQIAFLLEVRLSKVVNVCLVAIIRQQDTHPNPKVWLFMTYL